jgi:hypothetical protein
MKTLHYKIARRILISALLLTPPAAAQEKKLKERTPRREAEFTLRVIEASSGTGTNDAAALVPAELKGILKYDRYTLLDSAVVRGIENKELTITLAGNMQSELEFDFDSQSPAVSVRVEVSHRSTLHHSVTLLETETRVKSGETVVLGASRMRGGGSSLIVLLTAKLLP